MWGAALAMFMLAFSWWIVGLTGAVWEGWMLGSITLAPLVAGRLLPYPHLGTALLAMEGFAFGSIVSVWILAVGVEPATDYEDLGAFFWSLLAPLYAVVLAFPTYWVAKWRRV